MHAEKFLHKLFNKAIHKKRIILLGQMLEGVIETKQLSLTAVGRRLKLPIQERSAIRKVDRCLSNAYFQDENIESYRYITKLAVGNLGRAEILIDWSKLPNVEEYVLRAALAAEGRAITLYEEVHCHKRGTLRKIHREFLHRLNELLPSTCRPIIVTDAGFHSPWFKEVLALGWDYVGRVRGTVTYEEGNYYKSCAKLHKLATLTPTYLGEKKVSHKSPLQTHLYIVKKKLQGRKKRNPGGSLCTTKDSKNYGRSQREPWLLTSSLSGRNAAKKVVAVYKRRMSIEEAFRDLKSSQYGFSMSENKTLVKKRLGVWLMIAALASLFTWIVGRAAEQQNLHYQFQANSIKTRRVLSFFYLGCQLIRKKITVLIDFDTLQLSVPIYE